MANFSAWCDLIFLDTPSMWVPTFLFVHFLGNSFFKIGLMSFYIISIVLFWWGGHCCPMQCDLLKIYCAPPNLGIARTWICWLNFAQRPIFSGLRFFNEPEISDSGPLALVPPGGLVLRIFTSWKNPSTSAGLEPANLGSQGEHITLRPTIISINKC